MLIAVMALNLYIHEAIKFGDRGQGRLAFASTDFIEALTKVLFGMPEEVANKGKIKAAIS